MYDLDAYWSLNTLSKLSNWSIIGNITERPVFSTAAIYAVRCCAAGGRTAVVRVRVRRGLKIVYVQAAL